MPDTLILPATRPHSTRRGRATPPFSPKALAPFSPKALVDQIATALAPLADNEGCIPKPTPGTALGDVAMALAPVLGNCTIAEAAFLIEPLRKTTDYGSGLAVGPQGKLVTAATNVLAEFVLHAEASCPADVVARAHFFAAHHWDRITIAAVGRKMVDDALPMFSGEFEAGQLFGGTPAFPDQEIYDIVPWWEDRAEALRDLAAGN